MDLNLDTSWRIGERSFRYICALIRDNQYRSLVEFGSGASTVRLAAEFPKMLIVSIEHDSAFLEQTRRLLAQAAPNTRVDLQHCRLRWRFLGGRPFFTYSQARLPEQVDLVIIDGPPGSTRRGREACLYVCYERLRIGGVVVLDDLCRQNEQQSYANWLAVDGARSGRRSGTTAMCSPCWKSGRIAGGSGRSRHSKIRTKRQFSN